MNKSIVLAALVVLAGAGAGGAYFFTEAPKQVVAQSRLPSTFMGRVVSVVDGRSLRVSAGGEEVTVRFIGVELPQRVEFKAEADIALNNVVASQGVRVTNSRWIEGGLYEGNVSLSDQDLAQMQLQNGMLVVSGSAAPAYKDLEALAKREQRGMWAPLEVPDAVAAGQGSAPVVEKPAS